MSELECRLLRNVHTSLPLPSAVDIASYAGVQGDYLYYHYACDGTKDAGWGCGYRTLQTLCSWLRFKLISEGQSASHPPSLRNIQQALVTMGDKPSSFLGSREWIGSVEVAMCLDYFYDVPGKIIHMSSGEDLVTHYNTLQQHFQSVGAPVMMGGNTDNASKAIMGVCKDATTKYLLILDPHLNQSHVTLEQVLEEKALQWRTLESFMADSFYNLCLPQFKSGTHHPCR